MFNGNISLFIIIFVVLGLGAFGAVYWSKTTNQSPALVQSEAVNALPAPSPTPMPFEELTIPYIAKKEYFSQLGPLEKWSENSNYTSYLTSYSSDGLKINGLLTQPKGQMPTNGWPAVVFVHGYIPPAQYRTTEKYTDYINFLARNGLVVFKIDLRGNGDSEGQAGGAYYSSDYITDTLNAYFALQGSNFVDPNKIGLWGHSMAGNVLLRSFAAMPSIPAVVIWAGAGFTYNDLSQFGISDASYQPQPADTERQRKRNELRELYGNAQDGNPFWKLVSPTDYLKDLKGAIQLHHAVNDEVVSVEYSRNLNKILDSTEVKHQLFEYPSGGHNLTGASFTQAMQRTVDFYKENLK